MVISQLDIFNTVGAETAYSPTFEIEVSDGTLNFTGLALVDNAKLSAISLVEIPDSNTAPVNLSVSQQSVQFSPVLAGGSDTAQVQLSNPGSNNIIIDSLRISGADAADFGTAFTAGTSVAGNSAINFKLWLSPQQNTVASRQAYLTLYPSAGDSLQLLMSGSLICPPAGTACDDGDSTTINDVEDGNCNCAGSPVTVTPAFDLNINCGGSSYTAVDGREFIPDAHYLSGRGVKSSNSISGTTDPDIYQSNRYGKNLAYAIPVPANGTYTVTLHFAEIWKGGFTIGKRVFDVSIENSLVLDDLDIYATAGSNAALSYSFTVAVNDAVVDIVTAASSNNSQINAIEISSDSAHTPAPVVQVALSNNSLSFGPLVPLSTDSAQISLNNTGSLNTAVDSVSWTGNNPGYFRHNLIPATAVSTGQSHNFTMYFDALNQQVSNPAAQLEIYMQGMNMPLVLNVQGSISCPAYGTACDDGDSSTVNDIEDGNCNCAGTPQNPNPTLFSLNINSGGPQYQTLGGKVFVSDSYYQGGAPAKSNSSISNTTDPTLYQSNRYGKGMGYAIPVPVAGSYQVTLHFCETWPGGFKVGKRVFDVYLENQLMLDDFDIYAAAGGATATTRTFTATVTDGVLNIKTDASSNNSLISAIEITELVTSGKRALAVSASAEGSTGEAFRLNVFPNPLSGQESLQLQWNQELGEGAQLELFTMHGQLAQRIALPGGEQSTSLKVNNLAPGTYFIRLSAKGIVESRKIVISN